MPAKPLAPLYQRPFLFADASAARLERALSRICRDDALVCGWWRVERAYLNSGLEHYRVYHAGKLFGAADIKTPAMLPSVNKKLAMFLAGMGMDARKAKLHEGKAWTRLDAHKRVHQPLKVYVRAARNDKHAEKLARGRLKIVKTRRIEKRAA